MKVTSDNSIYSLMVPTSRKGPSVKDQGIGVVATPAKTPSVRTDAQLIDEFNSRLAKQQLDWADSDKNGEVSKAEYLEGQKKLAALNDRQYDSQVAERHWAKLDPTGTGSLSEDELREGLGQLLPVKVGHLDSNFAERLRAKQTPA